MGLVTCLYTGEVVRGDDSLWSTLSAMGTSYEFLPNVTLATSLGLADPCMGSTIALTRGVLEEIGSFGAFADHLADDYEIGRAVRAKGYQVAIPAMGVGHTASEVGMRDLFRHELRWTRTIRMVNPMGHLGSVVTYGFPIALLAALLLGFNWPSLAVIMVTLSARLFLKRRIDDIFGTHAGPFWLLPARDLLSFAVFVMSRFGETVYWRGSRFSVETSGALTNPEGFGPMPMKSLFLQAPSFDGYDGGAGARYQMKREVKSFWFPTWLAQAAAMVPGSRLIDAPPHRLSFKDIEEDVKAHELIVIHTSTPSFKSDVRTAGMIRALNPAAKIGFIGAKVAVEPQQSMEACPSIDFVCRNEYEFTVQELANGADWSAIKGLSYRDANGQIVHNPEREILMDMDRLPSVLPLYKQLKVENYFGGYLLHPYMSWYTGRGCKSRCTFCLWPQTIGGHKYRYKSIEKVVEEVKYVRDEFPADSGNLFRRRHADR